MPRLLVKAEKDPFDSTHSGTQPYVNVNYKCSGVKKMVGGDKDRRLRTSKTKMRKALTALLRDRPLQEISVTELTQLASVNRGTFYSHYRDIYDMAGQIENEMFEEFRALMESYPNTALRAGLQPILRDVFLFISKNADMCVVLLEGDNTSLYRVMQAVNLRIMQEWGDLYGLNRAENGEYCMSFLVEGCIGLLRTWVKNGRREEPEKLAALAETMILHGIERLKR